MSSIISLIFIGIIALFGYDLYDKTLRKNWSKNLKLEDPIFYTHARSIIQGAPLLISTHHQDPALLSIERLGEKNPTPIQSQTLEPSLQSPTYFLWKGFSWKANHTIDTQKLNPGVYKITLQNTQNHKSYQGLFIVKPQKVPKVAVVLSTNTWQAYNDYADISNYVFSGLPLHTRFFHLLFSIPNIRFSLASHQFPAMPLPFSRPNKAINNELIKLSLPLTQEKSHLFRAEFPLIQFLESKNYDYGLYSDEDVQNDAALYNADIILFVAHAEYWSEEMLGRIKNYVELGKKVIFLSGNNAFRDVDFYKEGVVVKNFAVDKNKLSEILGTGYDAKGYGTYAPYKVINPNHFAFEGTNLKQNDLFGLGTSGHETDKMNSSSTNTELLALGTNDEGGAHMIIKTFDKGGWIFNFSSVTSASTLNEDTIMQKIVSNLIDKALKTK